MVLGCVEEIHSSHAYYLLTIVSCFLGIILERVNKLRRYYKFLKHYLEKPSIFKKQNFINKIISEVDKEEIKSLFEVSASMESGKYLGMSFMIVSH
jgi:hypothetical protein